VKLASLLERTAQIPAAPTAKGVRAAAGIPYLEAGMLASISSGPDEEEVVNALMGPMWHFADSETSWQRSIRAETALRTIQFTDYRVIQINANVAACDQLAVTPVPLTVQWQKGARANAQV